MNSIYENTATEVAEIGGKAFHLERLCAMGMNVPQFLVLPSQLFLEFLGEARTEYRRLL